VDFFLHKNAFSFNRNHTDNTKAMTDKHAKQTVSAILAAAKKANKNITVLWRMRHVLFSWRARPRRRARRRWKISDLARDESA
jgi:hypothetical protein